MQSEEIVIFSNNKTLCSWCIAEVKSCFNIRVYEKNKRSDFLNLNVNPFCILIDFFTNEMSDILDIYNYIKGFSIPIIILFDRKKILSYKMRSVFLDALFISVTSQSGHLLRILNSIRNGDFHCRQRSKFEKTHEVIKEDGCIFQCNNKSLENLNFSSQLEMSFETFNIFFSNSQLMKTFKEKVNNAARSDEPVLLLGESGCGKTYTAKYIHSNSLRANGPFVPLNVADLTPSLAESQLFGVIKGAYTGSLDSNGFFSAGNKGTLFFDEIGDLIYPIQLKLLDVLENYSYRKVGSTKNIKTNTRFIFATNADLKEKIAAGLFRKDLFYRLNVLTVRVPALREHKEDILYLAKQFVALKNKTISSKAIQKLYDYNWPGNIRELKNLLSRVCTFSSSNEIQADEIDFTNELF